MFHADIGLVSAWNIVKYKKKSRHNTQKTDEKNRFMKKNLELIMFLVKFANMILCNTLSRRYKNTIV